MEAAADDPYEVLGLEPGASRAQVERAYRFSMDMYGEDALATYSLLDPAELEGLRQRIHEAHQTLTDAERRRAHDEAHGFAPPEGQVLPFPTSSGGEGDEPELPDVLSGPDLQRLREERGLSLRHMADVSKIGTRFLEHIEGDRFSQLPPPVYLRGFLREYARILGLDRRAVAEAYMKRMPPLS
jgi:curved DNA-binding protein CbpA